MVIANVNNITSKIFSQYTVRISRLNNGGAPWRDMPEHYGKWAIVVAAFSAGTSPVFGTRRLPNFRRFWMLKVQE